MPEPQIERRWQAAVIDREQQVASAGEAFMNLIRMMADLRGKNGCPWDAEQSLASLRQYVLEEANEVCRAIDAIHEFEEALRLDASMPPANPLPPADEDRARTATKGLSIAHHPHHPDFDPAASCSGAPLPPVITAEKQAQLEVLYRDLVKELGDLLLQPVFMGDILRAMSREGVERSLERLITKLIGRHPHVYGKTAVADSAEVLLQWERIKSLERQNGE